MDLEELKRLAISGGMPAFTGKQLAEWIYKKRVTDFEKMNNISKKNREWLESNCEIGREAPCSRIKSADGTVKYLFNASKGRKIANGLRRTV